MKKLVSAAFAVTLVSSLVVSVSFEDELPAVSLGEEACAAGNDCHAACDRLLEACVKEVKRETKVGKCFQCCKTTEEEGRLPLDPSPTRDQLHQYMLDKCVFTLTESHFVPGFPHELHAAERFEPKTGKIAREIKEKYDAGATSEPSRDQGPKSSDESACVKGCSYRTKGGMDGCKTAHTLCLVKCPASAGGGCRK